MFKKFLCVFISVIVICSTVVFAAAETVKSPLFDDYGYTIDQFTSSSARSDCFGLYYCFIKMSASEGYVVFFNNFAKDEERSYTLASNSSQKIALGIWGPNSGSPAAICVFRLDFTDHSVLLLSDTNTNVAILGQSNNAWMPEYVIVSNITFDNRPSGSSYYMSSYNDFFVPPPTLAQVQETAVTDLMDHFGVTCGVLLVAGLVILAALLLPPLIRRLMGLLM